VAEILTRFCAVVALGEWRAWLGPKPWPEPPLSTLQKSIKKPTFGQWVAILRDLTQQADPAMPLVVGELIEFGKQQLLPLLRGEDANAWESLVQMRNDAVHSGGMPEEAARQCLNYWGPKLDQLVGQLGFLHGVEVCLYTGGAARRMAGPTAELGPEQPLPVPLRAELDRKGLADHVVLLRQGKYLDLWPLCDYGRAVSETPSGPWEAGSSSPWLYYRSQPDRLQHVAVGSEVPFAERPQQVAEQFRQLFSLNAPVSPANLPLDFDREIEDDAAQFVGRKQELADLVQAVAEAQSGVLWVGGSGGIGKSYLMAAAGRHRKLRDSAGDTPPAKLCLIAWRFKAGDLNRCNRRAFFRHAVSRLARWLGRPGYLSADTGSELLAQFRRLLDDVAALQPQSRPDGTPYPNARARRVVFLLDGMDEIERLDPEFPGLLFQLAPANVVWVCAGRPERTLPRVFAAERCRHVFGTAGGLPPMGENDIRAMLIDGSGSLKYGLLTLDQETPDRGVVNEAVDAVVSRAAGLPLYVRFVVDDILARRRQFDKLATLGLPDGLTEYYDEMFKGLGVGDLQALLTPLVVTIAWANEPLGEDALLLLLDWRRTLTDDESGRAVLREALSRVQSLVRAEALPGGSLGYQPYHPTLRDHVRSDLARAGRPPQFGHQNTWARRSFAYLASRWRDLGEAHPARGYALRQGLSHLLDDGPAGASAALELCLRDGGAYLREAIRAAGPGWVEDRAGRVFAAAFGRRAWVEASEALLVLRYLHRGGRPVSRALALLFNEAPAPERLAELEEVSNLSTRLALALLAAVRWQEAGHPAAVDALLSWVERQPGVDQAADNDPAAEVINVLFSTAPTELVERLFNLPLFEETRQRWSALVHLWGRSGQDRHRAAVMDAINGDPEAATANASSAVEAAVYTAAAAGDGEMLLAACGWLGRCAVPLDAEKILHANIAERLPDLAPRAVRLLRVNHRMKNGLPLRVSVCALMLDGSPSAEAEFLALGAELAAAADVSLHDVQRSMAEYLGLWGDVWSMTPPRFREWLSVRLAFVLPAFADADEDGQAILRQLTVNLCTALRWVATQEPREAGNQGVVGECLSAISALAWRQPAPDLPRFLEGGKRASPVADIDPLRASACLRTANWLAQQGRLPHGGKLSTDDVDWAAIREVLRLVFAPSDEAELARLDKAFASAWGQPATDRFESVSRSPWLPAYRAIADAAGQPWQPSWEPDLGSQFHPLPERLTSYLKQSHERVLKAVKRHGWHPALLDLGVNLRRMLPERTIKDDDTVGLVLKALEEMDPEVLARCPSDMSGREPFLPALQARLVPGPLAEALAFLELNEYGILEQVVEDLCRPGKQWQESVRRFRDELRRLVLSTPRPVVWYRRKTRSPGELLGRPMAALNLLLDDEPTPADLEKVGSNLRVMEKCLSANPRLGLLAWAVEEFRGYRDEYRRWLFRPLLLGRHWDLLARFLERPAGEDADLLRGFRLPEIAPPSALSREWSDVLAEGLGMGPAEGIIYRLPELARQMLAGKPFDDPYVQRHRDVARLNPGWEDAVRAALQMEHARPHEVVRTLLAVSLFTGKAEPAMLAGEMEIDRDLGSEFLWVGKAAVPALLTKERIAAVAESGDGLDALVALGEWDAVRTHLRAQAARALESERDDPLLGWYRAAAEFEPAEQSACLDIYLNLAPALLARRGSSPIAPHDLTPFRAVSQSLKYDGHTLPNPVIAAAKSGDSRLARGWMRAVLFEAANGPKRQADEDCLKTLCICAGAWLTTEWDEEHRKIWLAFVTGVCNELSPRALWFALFRGAASVRGDRLLDEVGRWRLPDDSQALLALFEVFTEHGGLSEVKQCWDELVERSRWPWLICQRACDALLDRREAPGFLELAREFLDLAWRRARDFGEEGKKDLLANLVKRAIWSRAEETLKDIEAAVRPDRPRTAALGRIALDVFLDEVRPGRSWVLADLQGPTLAWAVTALVEEAVAGEKASDLGEYNHTWSESHLGIDSGLGWLAVLLKTVFNADPNDKLLAWLGSWLPDVPADRDTDATVGKAVLNWASKEDAVLPDGGPLLDFAMRSLLGRRKDLSDQMSLIRCLLKASHRIDDCLNKLDEMLAVGDSPHWMLTKAAVVCGETLPDPTVAERYLRQLGSEERALAEERIAKTRGESVAARIDRLLAAPRTSQIVERLRELITEALRGLKTASEADLQAIGPETARQLADSPRLDESLAWALSELLSPAEAARLRGHTEHLDGKPR
jgi:hypothetical protein